MTRLQLFQPLALIVLAAAGSAHQALADEPELGPLPRQVAPKSDKSLGELEKIAAKGVADAGDALQRGDTAWMLTSSALVMLMVPGLALFYGGMVRRKNILATMMQSMVALSVVGLYWLVVGYSLAFGPSLISVAGGGLVGWHTDLFFLQGIETSAYLPGTNIPIYVHVMFQGMFAIITPALISGAVAERIRFWPFCLFLVLWVTFVYCPLAHMVWAFDWYYDDPLDARKGLGRTAIGLLGKMGTLDFAGGTVVHIAAGAAGLAAALVLRKRTGYPAHTMHPSSMVLTLLGAGLLWFGWFGFNGGSARNATFLAGSAFAATQAAAAAAGLCWMFVEWLMKGKPTALGLASGMVAGLVAVTPASGYIYAWGGVIIGLLAGATCYSAVALKAKLGYDDSLDAFGIHAIGGFLGAICTGLFCYAAINPSGGADGFFAVMSQKSRPAAIKKQLEALTPAIAELEKTAGAENLKTKQAENKLVQASATDKKPLEETLARAKNDAFAANDQLKRRKERQTKLRDELAALIGEEGVKKLIDSREAQKLGIAWTQSELDGAKITGRNGTLKNYEKESRGVLTQFFIQLKAAVLALFFAFAVSFALAGLVQVLTGRRFTTDVKSELEGLDQTEHGEAGFDFGGGMVYDAVPTAARTEPKAAKAPPGQKRFDVIVEGINGDELLKVWSELCKPSDQPMDADFKEIYPYMTTVHGNRFQLRGGDPAKLSVNLQKLFEKKTGKPITIRVEEWGRFSF